MKPNFILNASKYLSTYYKNNRIKNLKMCMLNNWGNIWKHSFNTSSSGAKQDIETANIADPSPTFVASPYSTKKM